MSQTPDYSGVAILIPCHNEALTIAKVLRVIGEYERERHEQERREAARREGRRP